MVSKSWYLSKTFWGAILAGIGGVLVSLGYSELGGMIASLGASLSVVGLRTAKTKIGK